MHTEAMDRLNKKKKKKNQDKAIGVWAEVVYRLSRKMCIRDRDRA